MVIVRVRGPLPTKVMVFHYVCRLNTPIYDCKSRPSNDREVFTNDKCGNLLEPANFKDIFEDRNLEFSPPGKSIKFDLKSKLFY